MLSSTVVLLFLVHLCNGNDPVIKKYREVEYSFDEEEKLNIDLQAATLMDSLGDDSDVEISLRKSSPIFYVEDNALKSHVSVNREKICEPSVEVCKVVLDLGVTKHSKFLDVIKLKLTIHDVNDHSPKFEQHRLVLNLSEDHDLLSPIALPAASDLDGPQFNILKYVLGGSQQFSLLENPLESQGVALKEPEMVLEYPLDREMKDFHRLVLTAYDKGSPPKSSLMNIEIHVIDVNDNSPSFRSSYSSESIMENSPPSNSIIQVEAQDSDLNDTDNLSYYFTENTQKLYGQWFKIDEKDGTVSNVKRLDYELLGSSVVLEVFAKDTGGLTSSPINVTINIGNVNDNVPLIEMDLPRTSTSSEDCLSELPTRKNHSVFYAEILEVPTEIQNTQEVSNVTRYYNLTVVDLDGDPNNFVFCEISSRSNDQMQLMQLTENQYQVCFSCDFLNEPVFVKNLFDREEKSCHFIDITCTDNGNPSLSSSIRLVINLIDLNDNPAIFEYLTYSFTIHTNNLCKSFEFGKVMARDKDEGANKKVAYTIESCMGLETSDHGRSDLLELQKSIKVSSSRGMLTMDLRDAGDCRQFSSILFRCEIIARNVEEPYFESSTTSYLYIEQTYKFQSDSNEQTKHMFVTENQPILSFVGNLKHIIKTRQNYTFTIMDGATSDFKVFKTGEIITQVYLDRELRDTYKFVISANLKNPKEGKSSRTIRLIIHVLDLNDNFPEFYKPRQGEDLIIYQEGVYARRKVYRVRAKDQDVGKNSVVSYSLLNNDNLMEINSSTGEIYLNLLKTHKINNGSKYHLTVQATDGGDKPQYSNLNFSIMFLKKLENVTTLGKTSKANNNSQFQLNFLTIILSSFGLGILLLCILLICVSAIKKRRHHKFQTSRSEQEGFPEPPQVTNTPTIEPSTFADNSIQCSDEYLTPVSMFNYQSLQRSYGAPTQPENSTQRFAEICHECSSPSFWTPQLRKSFNTTVPNYQIREFTQPNM